MVYWLHAQKESHSLTRGRIRDANINEKRGPNKAVNVVDVFIRFTRPPINKQQQQKNKKQKKKKHIKTNPFRCTSTQPNPTQPSWKQLEIRR